MYDFKVVVLFDMFFNCIVGIKRARGVFFVNSVFIVVCVFSIVFYFMLMFVVVSIKLLINCVFV